MGYQIPHVCSIALMYLFNQEFSGNCKVYLALYPLILPMLVPFLVGDVRLFLEARLYALYITFMIVGMQCWHPVGDTGLTIDDLHKRLYDTEWTWMAEMRGNNTWAWVFLVVATILCCHAWSKMNLRDTLLGKIVGRTALAAALLEKRPMEMVG